MIVLIVRIKQFNWFIKTLVPGVVNILEIVQEEIKWRPPSQPNGIITGYQVIYSIYQIPSTKMMSEVLDNTITEFSIDNLSEYIRSYLNSLVLQLYYICEYYVVLLHDRLFSTAPGVPYEVVVVAFTSAGKGTENDYIIFFSEELAPTKSPENVVFQQINSTALNITWTPLTLFEARGFPIYRVVTAKKIVFNSAMLL